jgi:hypothetical protein
MYKYESSTITLKNKKQPNRHEPFEENQICKIYRQK